VLVVLARKAASVESSDWVDEAFDEDEYEDDDDEDDEFDTSPEGQDDTPLHERHGMTLEDVANLAKEAAKVGVMQATPATEQGSTGWYVDVSEELQYWEVTPDGEWIRHE